VLPSGPWFEAMRNGDFDVVLEAPGHGLVNPLLDIQKVLPASVDAENYGQFEDQTEIDLYEKLLHETDPAQQRTLMRGFEKYVLDEQSHMIWVLWWIDGWHGAPELAKIANVRTVGGIVFPGSLLAADKEELQDIAGFWPDIEKSRAEARRLLHEAQVEGFSFELVNRNVDQPYKYDATWVIDQWSKIGLHVTQRVLPTGPWLEAMRQGNFDAAMNGNCNSVVNPLLDVQRYLSHSVYVASYGQFEDQQEIDLYDRMLHETEFANQRALMRDFEKHVLDSQAHEIFLLWYYRIVPYRSYVKGWKISPSHYLNQDLAAVWLDK
jgi:peptide/nickel transport system substrate-binding protein